MEVLVKTIKNQWETCCDIEDAMKRYLNMNHGQLKYFYGSREDYILITAAEELKKRGVSARNMEDSAFNEIVKAIRNSEEETDKVEEIGRSEK